MASEVMDLPGAGFADQAQDFAGGDGEAEVADGWQRKRSCRDSRRRLSGRPQDGGGSFAREMQCSDCGCRAARSTESW